MSDEIILLDIDNSVVTDKEKHIIDIIFNNQKKTKKLQLKNVIIASGLFTLLSLSLIDEKIPISNMYYKLLVKTLIFTILYFCIINYFEE
jgi:hypothetical protein